GIISRRLHELELACVGARNSGGAYHVVVVVDGATLQQHPLAIQEEAPFGVEAEAADAEPSSAAVHERAAYAYLLHQGIEVGRVHRPQRGDWEAHRLIEAFGGARRDCALGFAALHFAPGARQGNACQHRLDGLRSGVHHRGLRLDLGPVARDGWRADRRAPRIDVELVQDLQADRADDPRPRVPARGWLLMI